ncbi:phage tail tube protein [Pseudonocardia asaccharolytica]|uniref:Major tail protein n=1 Tax=Pseudonocardia asaccharolytica DSM 44247 = NBRC 16224 TaxID=1123024 RepID=A0A511D3J8_9PSEU|nr:hypothetical protein [Pseudonocardia asaccharolytica]GEL19361.1 hypothetical protein PA7_31980 [Pseudonocardia asaccharolytica DSM 44247 = NBRC 16224]
MPLLEDIQQKQNELIRKWVAASMFVAPETAAVPTTLTTYTAGPPETIELAALPVGPPAYVDLGLVTKDDGYSWGNEWDVSETTSHGYADPTRRDILTNTSTVGFTAQETKKTVLEMFHNVDLSAVTPDTDSGEVTFAKPLQQATRYYRAFFIGRDGVGPQTIYMGALYPRAMVSETGEQTGSEESEYAYPMTLTATPDQALGTSVRFFFGGPGWKALLTKMGFTP